MRTPKWVRRDSIIWVGSRPGPSPVSSSTLVSDSSPSDGSEGLEDAWSEKRGMEEAHCLVRVQDASLVSQPFSGTRQPVTPHSPQGQSYLRDGRAQACLRSQGPRQSALCFLPMGRAD